MLTKNQEKYLATLPEDKIITIYPYSPHLQEIADQLIAKVRALHPELEVHFGGSAALGIAGQNDLDIDWLCAPDLFEKYYPTLVGLFGEPRDKDGSMAAWSFKIEGQEVDMWLTDSTGQASQEQWRLFLILKNSPALCQEYEKIKLAYNGKSYKEYQRAKYEFYNRLLVENV